MPSTPPPHAASALPEQFGPYRIKKRLGQGGMGTVYLALDTRLNRPVALKVCHLADNPEAMERFKREAQAAAALRHPNLCPVYDCDVIDGTPYFTMAFIEGPTLDRWIAKRGGVTQKEAAILTRKLAIGLATAHKAGVIHRDLKPANVVLDKGGEPVILDFGLARQGAGGEQRLTQDGAFLGTPSYMAPEQVGGDPTAMGRSCDIYSLGVMLYEMLTGQLPFEGDLRALIGQVLFKEPTPPRQIKADVDESLEAICLKAMAKKVDERWATMEEMGRAVTEWLKGGSTAQARPPQLRVPRTEEVAGQSVARTPEATAFATILAEGEPAPSPKRNQRRGRKRDRGQALPWLVALGLLIILASVPLARLILHRPAATPDVVAAPVDGGVKDRAGEGPPPVVRGDAQADTIVVNSIGMLLVPIRAGTFKMGSPASEPGRLPREGPQRRVEISKPFHLVAREVTQEQYERVMGNNPSAFSANGKDAAKVLDVDTRRLPVESVSWHDAVEFCRRLSAMAAEEKGGRTYRLPTEAEWEYCCRAGTTTAFFCGDRLSGGQINYDGGGYNGGLTRPGPGLPTFGERFAANGWGLHDMHGNVYEWCQDWYADDAYASGALKDPVGPAAGKDRVVRGGSWLSNGFQCRSAYRDPVAPDTRLNYIGFRVVMEQFPPPPAMGAGVAPAAITNSVGMEFASIPAGKFQMGSLPGEVADVLQREKPRHLVEITKPFHLGVHEVTQAEYARVMGGNPSAMTPTGLGRERLKDIVDTGRFPVEMVSWEEATEFCRKLSELPDESAAGRHYRLPTEAEWEYACRAGNNSPYTFGNQLSLEQANFTGSQRFGDEPRGQSLECTCVVGSHKPNAWGLYDMHGNVWEWCQDWFDGNYYSVTPVSDPPGPAAGILRVVRGGGWNSPGEHLRSANRGWGAPGRRENSIGFRVVMTQR